MRLYFSLRFQCMFRFVLTSCLWSGKKWCCSINSGIKRTPFLKRIVWGSAKSNVIQCLFWFLFSTMWQTTWKCGFSVIWLSPSNSWISRDFLMAIFRHLIHKTSMNSKWYYKVFILFHYQLTKARNILKRVIVSTIDGVIFHSYDVRSFV